MITRKMLKKAAEDAAMRINESLPSPEACDHEFSTRFENQILNYKAEKSKSSLNHPVLKLAISFFLIFTLGSATILVLSPEVRAAVDSWVRSFTNSLYQYIFEGDVSNTGDHQYEAQWIPEGYKMISNETIMGNTDILYENENEDTLLISYTNATTDTGLYIDSEDGIPQTIDINGYKADLYLNNDPSGRNVLVWVDQETGTLFFINGRISKDEIIKIAQNISKK